MLRDFFVTKKIETIFFGCGMCLRILRSGYGDGFCERRRSGWCALLFVFHVYLTDIQVNVPLKCIPKSEMVRRIRNIELLNNTCKLMWCIKEI